MGDFLSSDYSAAAPSYEMIAGSLKFIGSAFSFGTIPLNTDFPASEDVRSGVSYDGDLQTGTLVLPLVSEVQAGVAFGGAGDEFIGNVVLPLPAEVLDGVGYGSQASEFVGTLVGGVSPKTQGLTQGRT